MEKQIILVIHEDYHEARGIKDYLAGRLDRHRFEICGRIVSHEKTISDCRNLEPIAVLLNRNIVLKKEFSDLTTKIRHVCRNARIFIFDNEPHLKKIISGKFFREVQNVSRSYNYPCNSRSTIISTHFS